MDVNVTTSSFLPTTDSPDDNGWTRTFPLISGVLMWAFIILLAIFCRHFSIECCSCLSRVTFKVHMFLAHTWPCSKCVDEPSPDDDVSIASDVSNRDDNPPEYSIALNMPKPERDTGNNRRTRRSGRRNSVDVIALTDVNQSPSGRSSVTPPPVYTNQGLDVFDEVDATSFSNLPSARRSRDVRVQIETDDASDSVSSASTSRNSQATPTQDPDLPSYEDAIRNLFLARRHHGNSNDVIQEDEEEHALAELPV